MEGGRGSCCRQFAVIRSEIRFLPALQHHTAQMEQRPSVPIAVAVAAAVAGAAAASVDAVVLADSTAAAVAAVVYAVVGSLVAAVHYAAAHRYPAPHPLGAYANV